MISGKELAPLLGVTPQALSAAVKRGHYCGEHDVSCWAVLGASGVVRGYEVPPSVLNEIASEKQPQGVLRPNPPDSESPAAAQEPSAPSEVHSLLPPDQDYLRPVAAFSLAHVTAKAIEADNAPARGVLLVGGAAAGGAFGSVVAGKKRRGTGFVLGAGVAVALMAWGLGLLKSPKNGCVAGQGGDREILPGEATRMNGVTGPGGFHDTALPATGVTFSGTGAGIARNFGSGVEVFRRSSRSDFNAMKTALP